VEDENIRKIWKNHIASKAGKTGVALGILLLVVLPFQANAIRFGTIDTTHTYAGALIIEGFVSFSGTKDVFCSGTLVSPRVFLTAAECPYIMNLLGFSVDHVFVSFTTNVLADRKSWIPVTGYAIYPGFKTEPSVFTTKNDWATFILSKPVRNIPTATLAPVGYLDQLFSAGQLRGATFTTVGYGMDADFAIDGTRKAGTAGFLNLDEIWLFMNGNANLGASGPCYGDSGGPTIYNDGNRELVVALVS